MLPSDLELRIGTIANFKNNIIIAESPITLGYNPTLNDPGNLVHSVTQSATHSFRQSVTRSQVKGNPTNKKDEHEVSKIVLTGSSLLVAGLFGLYYFK